LTLSFPLPRGGVPAAASATPPPGAYPPALNFGDVYVGSLVEGSFWIVGTEMSSIKSAPTWMRIIRLDADKSHAGGKGTVVLGIDTSSPGSLSGVIVVETDSGDISIPVSATVKESPDPRVSILVYETPFQGGATSNATHLEPVAEFMASAGANVSYLDPADWHRVSGSLDQFDVVILADSAFWSMSPERLVNYVRSGGYLVVFASSSWVGQVDLANQVVEALGLRFRDERIGSRVVADELADHWLTDGVSTLEMFHPSPVEATSAEATVIASYPGSSPTEGMIAFSEAGDGGVLAIGASLWWASFLGSPDRERILLNLFDYAAEAGGAPAVAEDLSAELTPERVELSAGESAEMTLTLTSVGGFESDVLIGWTVSPSTAHLYLGVPSEPVYLPAGGSLSESVQLQTSQGIEPGEYTVTLTCVAGSKRKEASATVVVSAGGETPTPTPTSTPAPTTTQPPTQAPTTEPPQSPAATPTGPQGGGWLSTPLAAALGAVAGAAVVALAVWAASRSRARGSPPLQGDEKARVTY